MKRSSEDQGGRMAAMGGPSAEQMTTHDNPKAGQKRKAEDSDTSSSNASDKKPKAFAPKPTTEKKAKNFAERLMKFLLAGTADNTIWWIGDGEAVAIHTKNLKNSDFLESHFMVKDYPVFIRNCNRWGFRRTVQYPVPQGVITYQCSLFLKAEPQLVHHMRMDSDVQDVFSKHRDLKGENVPFDPKRLRKEARARARSGGGGQFYDPRFPPPGFNDSHGQGLNLASFAVASSPSAPFRQNLHELNALHSLQRDDALQMIHQANLNSLGASAAAAAGGIGVNAGNSQDPPGLNAGPSRPTDMHDPSTTASLSPTSDTEAVKRLLGVLGSARSQEQQRNPPPQQQQQQQPVEGSPRQNRLLGQILSLSDEYLNHPGQVNVATNNEPIRMALNLLRMQARKLQEEATRKSALDRQLSAYVGNIAGAPAPVATANSNTNHQHSALLAQALQQQRNNPAASFSNVLGGGGGVREAPPQQQQQSIQADLLAQLMSARAQVPLVAPAPVAPPPQQQQSNNQRVGGGGGQQTADLLAQLMAVRGGGGGGGQGLPLPPQVEHPQLLPPQQRGGGEAADPGNQGFSPENLARLLDELNRRGGP